MKKTITITLNEVIFNIEDDAYEVLEKYLNSIKEHFSKKEEDSKEIIADIEASIAEKFSKKFEKKQGVVTLKDVEDLISVMGTVADIVGEEDEEKPRESKTQKPIKKLYRDTENGVIAGVCAGLAAYIGVDAVIVRVVFLLSVLIGGTGVIVYLVLWLIVPEAKTSSQKLEMEGDPINLQNIKETVEEKISNIKKKDVSNIKNGVNSIFGVVGNIIKWFFIVLSIIIGVSLIVSAVAAIFGITFAGAILLFNINSPYIVNDLPIQEITQGAMYYLGVISVCFVIIIPLIYIFLLGLLLTKRKNVFSTVLNSVLIGVWMLAIIFVGVVAIDFTPKIERTIQEFQKIENSEKTFEFDNFNAIESSGSYDITIIKGDDYNIKAIGVQRALDDLIVRKNNGDDQKLEILRDKKFRMCIFCYVKPIKLEIEMPKLQEIDVSGSSDLDITGFGGEKMSIKSSGSSTCDMKDIDFEKLDIDSSGYSKFILSGIANEVNIESSGASNYSAYDLEIEDLGLDLSGSSKGKFNVSESIEVKASGASKVYYKGSPEISSDLSGSSKIEKTED